MPLTTTITDRQRAFEAALRDLEAAVAHQRRLVAEVR